MSEETKPTNEATNAGSVRVEAVVRPLHCCFEGCPKDAEFLIIDTNEKRYDIAETHACEDHLGSLIGSVEPTEPKGPWSVYVLA